ncbi:MAG: recombinase XerC, partial [Sphingomonadales bacterium]
MTREDILAAWHSHLTAGRRRSPHTVRAYTATAARLIDGLGERPTWT